jgi:hypothetical protein
VAVLDVVEFLDDHAAHPAFATLAGPPSEAPSGPVPTALL